MGFSEIKQTKHDAEVEEKRCGMARGEGVICLAQRYGSTIAVDGRWDAWISCRYPHQRLAIRFGRWPSFNINQSRSCWYKNSTFPRPTCAMPMFHLQT
ncbi:hypothetical protein LZ30DRAFT_107396 [Colletotrichum cereale]|nr:hypothetical protein LZ30DRAFT_107396 [Colletotrichum cereale]